MDKKIVMIGAILGTTIGSYVPVIFGASIFSMTSILGSGVGGVLGLWISFKFFN